MTNLNTHNMNNTGKPGHIPNHRLNDLLFEVSCQRDSIPVDELRKKRIISQVLHQCGGVEQSSRSASEMAIGDTRPVFRFVRMAVAAVMLLAALAALYVEFVQDESHAFQPQQLSRVQSLQPAMSESNPEVVSPETASPLAINDVSIVHPGAGVEMAIGPDSQYQLAPKQPKGVSLRLSSGIVWISKDPHHKKLPLAIETPHLTIRVTGTSLSVQATAGTTVVKVFDGEVQVTDFGKTSHMLRAGDMLTTEALITRTEPISELSLEKEQLVKLGLKVTHPGNKSGKPGPTVVQTKGMKRGESAAPQSEKKDAASAKSDSFDALYADIQLHRKDKQWQAAADGYEQLITRFSGTSKSQAAKVAIANLYIEKLHQPDIALSWYEKYLQGNSTSLFPEALLGKARALREMDKTDSEQRILEQIVQKYPESIYGVQVKQRLMQLQKR